MCAYCPLPPLILHSLLDEDICSFVPADFIWQKPICLPGTKRLYFLYLVYLPFLTEPDVVVVNLFKNNAAGRSKEMEENSSKGKKRLRSESTSIVSEVYRVKRQVRTDKSTVDNPIIDKSTGAWITAVKNLQSVLLTHCAGTHSKETQESWWNLIAPEGRWPFNTDGNVYFISFF